jgi:hypothetical protein
MISDVLKDQSAFIFCDMTLYHWINDFWCFEGSEWLHIHGKGIQADHLIVEDEATVILQNISRTLLHLKRPVYVQNENVFIG